MYFFRQNKKLWVLAALICTLPAQAGGRRQMNALVGGRIDASLVTLRRSAEAVGDSLSFPTYGESGHWKLRPSNDWVSGRLLCGASRE